MNKPIKPNITIPESFAENGIKTEFDNDKLANGFDELLPDVFAGDNLNKFIDDHFKASNYSLNLGDYVDGFALRIYDETENFMFGQWVIFEDEIWKSKQDNNIGHIPTEGEWWEKLSLGGGGLPTGYAFFSLDPLVEDNIHLLDGSLLPIGGIYNNFIYQYIIPLLQRSPQRFKTEEEWQAINSQYGACGYYVYTEGVGVRLPKVTGIVEGTLDINALGQITEAGIPNIYGTMRGGATVNASGTGAFSVTGEDTSAYASGGYRNYNIDFDASRVSNVYKNGMTTVQPQTISGYYYIVLGTVTKDPAEVEIDNIVTDLNGKADVDLANTTPTQSFKDQVMAWNGYDYSAGVSIVGSQTFIPVSNGVIIALATASSSENGVEIYYGNTTEGEYRIGISVSARSSGTFGSCEVRVNEGEQYTIKTYGSSYRCKFYPCKGV